MMCSVKHNAESVNNLPKKWAKLPFIRGVYKFNEPLDRYTSFGIGGPAEVMFVPQDMDDLATFMAGKPQDVALTILGEGSNILVRDGGIPDIVIHLSKGCDSVTVDGLHMRAQSGASTGKAARAARSHGLTNLEWICGIPGTIGGALVMNAGCYGWEMKDVLTGIEVITDTGERKTIKPEEAHLAYRSSNLPQGWIYAAANFELAAGDEQSIRRNMREVNTKRRTAQPLELPNAGSVFKNPPGQSAWKLIEAAGCRGWRKGDAQVSEKHCNFFVNLGKATAADMEDLAEDVRQKVKKETGVMLRWEVKRLGKRL